MRPFFKLNNNQKVEIKNELKKILEAKQEILFTYVHGSFLVDLPFHDIDLAIFIQQSYINELDVVDYEIQLAIELELKISLPIDIKVINSAPLLFRYNITKGEILFCRNKDILYDFVEITWMEYLDFKPYYLQNFNYLYNIKVKEFS